MPNFSSIHSHFNSTIVRLKHIYIPADKDIVKYFNSTIVRLKPVSCCPCSGCPSSFQFYNSSIKTFYVRTGNFRYFLFQFYNSSIKTNTCNGAKSEINGFQFYNSSIKTLKLQALTLI